MSTGAVRTRGWRQRNALQIEQRRRELLTREHDRARKAFDSGHIAWSTLPETRVLTGWHTDEFGCRARTVGNEGN